MNVLLGEQAAWSVGLCGSCLEQLFVIAMSICEPSLPNKLYLPPQTALQAFKNGTTQVLVATDVAGRGLHIKSLPYIVNYDFPARMEAYIHRVGRTGRLASSGHAFSFFTRNLAPLARPLLTLLLVCKSCLWRAMLMLNPSAATLSILRFTDVCVSSCTG